MSADVQPSAPAAPASDEPVLRLVPTQEERLLRESVFGIASRYGLRYMADCCNEKRPPSELWDEIAGHGFVGANLPEQFGGGGAGMTGLAAVQEELGRAGCTLAFLIVSPAIAGSILVRHGSREQQERWLPGIAAGSERLSFAITEADAGSNSHQIATRARRLPDGRWTLHGQKTFISGVEHATAIFLVARRELDDGTLGLPVCFVVDADAPGLTKQEIPTAARMADLQWTLFLDGVTLGEDRLIGGDGGGLGAVFDGLNPERIMAAAGAVGAADLALERAADYARERAVWGRPIGTHQAIAHPLAECKVQVELARLMLRKACALYDAGAAGAGEASNMAKFAAADAAVHAVDRAIQTHGGNGMALEYGLTEMYWGARLGQIAPVSREMILNYVAQHSLGLPKSY